MAQVQSKWIVDIQKIILKDWKWEEGFPMSELLSLLLKVDVLLQIAALETENEFLHDDIMKLIKMRTE